MDNKNKLKKQKGKTKSICIIILIIALLSMFMHYKFSIAEKDINETTTIKDDYYRIIEMNSFYHDNVYNI